MGKNKWTIFVVLLSLLLASCAGQAESGPTAPVLAVPEMTATPFIPQSGLTDIPALQTEALTEVPAMQTAVAPQTEAVPQTEQTEIAGAQPSAAPAPECSAPAALTPAMTEGPYYTSNPPEQANLYQEGIPGQRLLLTGYVLNTQCQPVAGARVDFWQADGAGVYDNSGYTLRGYQLTGADGSYRLDTVIPGEYPGRTPHIHVKVSAPGGPELTSQVFFPEMAGNQTDRIFDPALVVEYQDPPGTTPELVRASFNFIINE